MNIFLLFQKITLKLGDLTYFKVLLVSRQTLKKEGSILLDACKVRFYVTGYNFRFHRQVEGSRCTSNVLFSNNMKSIKAEFFKKVVNIPYKQSFALHPKKRKKRQEKRLIILITSNWIFLYNHS